MLSLLLIFLIVIVVIILWLKKKLSYWSRQGVASDSSFSTNGWLEELHEYTWNMSNKYGKIYAGYTLAYDFLVINDPELIREVYIKYFDVFPSHLHINISPEPKVNKMLFFMAGDENWKRIRSIISPTFTSGKLKAMISSISEISDELVDKLENLEKIGEEIDMRQYIGAFAMDVISSCGYGIKLDSKNNPDHPLVLNAKKILSLDANLSMLISIFSPKMAEWMKLNFFDIEAVNVLAQLIDDVRKKRRDNEMNIRKKTTDFIQLMLDSEIIDEESSGQSSNKTESRLTNDEMTAQGIIFLIAGYDTTTAALSHVFYYLAKNKDCQQRLYEELKDVKEFSYENLSQLKYLNAVIDETLRLAPPVLRIQRQNIKDFELAGIRIPAGTCVEFTPYALHRDPELWPDPLEFKPERFIEQKHHPYAYLPFGAGPRICIGERFVLSEMRMCCAKLFSKFEFNLRPGFKPQYFKGNIIFSPKTMMCTLNSR